MPYINGKEIKVIATDLDGTLFYPKKRIQMIPKKNAKFLKRFTDDGGRVVCVSSRADNFPPRIAEHLDCPFDFVGADGAFVMIDGEIKERTFFEPSVLREVIFNIKAECEPWIFMLTSKTKPLVLAKTGVKKVVSTIYVLYMFAQGAYKENAYRSDHIFFSEVNRGEVYKLMLFIGITKKQMIKAKRLAEEINAKYDSIEAHWLNEVVEITPKGCSKSAGLSKYLDYLGVSHDNIMVVGDGGNDIPMFDAFPEHSYAMEHAHQTVKSHASKTIRMLSDLENELYPSADSKKSVKKN